jgi:hypothetical protein
MSEGRRPRGGPRTPVVTRQLTLALDEFGQSSLEDHARALKVPLAAIVSQAALYFLAQRGEERAAMTIPRFARGRPYSHGRGLELALELHEEDWSTLEVEAVHQKVPLERLLEHAALLFLADIDAGRVAIRVVEQGEYEENR